MNYLRKLELDLRFSGLRERTISSYLMYVKIVLKRLNKNPEELDSDDVNQLLIDLYEEGAAAKTIIVYYSALKFFLIQTLEKEWKISRIPKLRYYDRYQPRPLTRSEVKQIISGPGKHVYRVIFALMYSAGLRVSEACSLKVQDLNPSDMLIHIENGKGGMRRKTVLSHKIFQMLQEYLKSNPSRTWIFPARKNAIDSELLFNIPTDEKPMHPRSVQREFRLTCNRLNIPGQVSLHSLRHSFATHLIEDGLSIFSIQKLLGHKSLRATMQYLKYAQARPQNYFSPYDMLE